MNIFYDEKLAKEMEEEARLQAIFERALTDLESLNEVSDENLEKLMPYMEYIKMAEAEEMKMLAEMKEE